MFNLISLKCSITYVFSHYDAKSKLKSYDFVNYRKSIDVSYIIILIKSVLNEDKNHYYYNTFLEKCSYQLAKK